MQIYHGVRMKYINLTIVLIAILLALGCNKANEKSLPDLVVLKYDSLLVDSVVNITSDLVVANLIEWTLDQETSEAEEDMIFFNNINSYGMITAKAYSDGKILDYVEEIKTTFHNATVLSDSEYIFNENNYYQYILQSKEYILLKAIIEINENDYIDTNILVLESKYPELARMIETYLASISILN